MTEQLAPIAEAEAAVGDWLEADLLGGSSKRGQIVEILGSDAHRHFRVRWDEAHESIHFPAEGERWLRATGANRRHAR